MTSFCNYNPLPPRAWSRVQDPCTYTLDSSYNSVYIPLTKQTVSLAQADYETKLQYKGNILQYKNNSSRITKAQKYSQISKGLWCNRQKVYATQGITYTNPNTTGLLRVGYTSIPFPNEIVGYPNNISGPYQYAVPNPNDCTTSTTLQDGGTLICSAYQNPCTGKITKSVNNQKCYPNYCSDVPGPITNLCWDSKMNTYFPRQRYIMNNSGNKFPTNYKLFVSADHTNYNVKTIASKNFIRNIINDSVNGRVTTIYNNLNVSVNFITINSTDLTDNAYYLLYPATYVVEYSDSGNDTTFYLPTNFTNANIINVINNTDNGIIINSQTLLIYNSLYTSSDGSDSIILSKNSYATFIYFNLNGNESKWFSIIH